MQKSILNTTKKMYSYLEEAGYTGKISKSVVVNLMEKNSLYTEIYLKKASTKHVDLLR